MVQGNIVLYKPIIKKLILECTIQVFDYTDQRTTKADGSVIYLKSENNHYLISAAHVLDMFKRKYGIQLNKEALIPPGGTHYLSQKKFMNKDERERDKIDVGIMKLDELSSEKISSIYHPMSLKNIEISASGIERNESYVICGYPSTNKFTKINPSTGTVLSTPFVYYTGETDIEYSTIDYDRNEHILLNVETTKTTKQTKENPIVIKSLEGLSGSGVWKMGVEKIQGKYYPYGRLVGIVNYHYHNNQQEYIVATKIDFITEFIRVNLNENISSSNFLTKEKLDSIFPILT